MRGSALSSRGLMLKHQGKLVQGLRTLVGSNSEFSDAIELNPRFHDAYLGRGAYRYAVATNSSVLSWLPFIPSKESGWQDLWLAVDSSKFSSFPALSALVWFVLDDHNYSLADSICRAGLQRFPHSRNFLWPLLSLQVRQSQWAEAETTAADLLGHYLNQPDNNGYDVIGLYWRLMKCADALNKPEQAIEYARAGLNSFHTPAVAERRKDKLLELENRVRP